MSILSRYIEEADITLDKSIIQKMMQEVYQEACELVQNMFIIAVTGKESKVAYSVQDGEGNQILYLFEEEDDAERYAMMLEDRDYPEMHVLEVEDEIMIQTCRVLGYKYTVITPNDIVIPPPDIEHDFI